MSSPLSPDPRRHRSAPGPTPTPQTPPHHSGQKKAVFIGINYFGTKAELFGCCNDVKNVKVCACLLWI